MNQKGNVLFLILIAVALFAALSYAVTRASRSSDANTSKESADTVAADILNWFSLVDGAVTRMRLINNIPVDKLDFNDPNNLRVDGVATPFDNTNCATTSCEVFSPLGGKVSARVFKSAADKTYTPSATNIAPGGKDIIVTNTPNVGTSLPDITMRVTFVSKEVCGAINRKVGIPEVLNGGRTGSYVQFMGNATQITNALNSGSAYTWSAPEIAGKNTFCDFYSTGPFYQVYHVVVER